MAKGNIDACLKREISNSFSNYTTYMWRYVSRGGGWAAYWYKYCISIRY